MTAEELVKSKYPEAHWVECCSPQGMKHWIERGYFGRISDKVHSAQAAWEDAAERILNRK